jgi:hypothetical protein
MDGFRVNRGKNESGIETASGFNEDCQSRYSFLGARIHKISRGRRKIILFVLRPKAKDLAIT